ncbi:MAG: GNAT family N-acetyltransferase [Candidatus Cloacimonadaceae bacterium]|nr:GNAT family N-acetyltransferase [Candidatus Cloacimonadota bacterium]MDX9949312.1 GNAT family N-acetyltransferase [Candidatus Syntrophosphaera sp.]NLN84829.1 GNAT family N-acetyltransferase [Candidatus Cloacimonadota bacterium]
MTDRIEISIVKEADPEQILALYRHQGWWEKDENPQYLETVKSIVENSFCFAIAKLGDKIVGMGRSISDGNSDAYIQDVVVHSDLRGQGIGAGIMKKILEHLHKHKIQWIGLISEPGQEDFYGKLGFLQMPNYTPMLLEMPKEKDTHV